jgi:hypothetical protein
MKPRHFMLDAGSCRLTRQEFRALAERVRRALASGRRILLPPGASCYV